MKQIVITIGAIFLFANLAFALVLDSFGAFNLLISSGVIVFTAVILFAIAFLKIKDGFRVPLYVFNSICGFIEYVIALFARNDMKNNWFYVALILIIVSQFVLLITTSITSKKNQ